MKNSRIFRALFFIVLVPALLLGDFGQIFTYQGKLTDASGVPQEDPVEMTFSIHTALTGGTEVWNSGAIAGIDPVHGIFSITLEPVGVVWDDYSELWLQVTVGVTDLTPRERLTSAFNALNVADDAVNENKIDWGVGVGPVSAEDVPIEDAGGYYDPATDVENALQEIGALIGGDYVVFHPAVVQNSGDVTTPLIHLNESGTGTANLIELETGGLDMFVVNNDGDAQINRKLGLTPQSVEPSGVSGDLYVKDVAAAAETL